MSRAGGDLVKSPTREFYNVAGRVIGTAGPSVAIKDGFGFTVSRTGTGVYVVTPDVKYPRLIGGGHGVMSASNPLAAKVSAYTVGVSVTFTVYNTTTGTATDLGTTEELWFMLGESRSVNP